MRLFKWMAPTLLLALALGAAAPAEARTLSLTDTGTGPTLQLLAEAEAGPDLHLLDTRLAGGADDLNIAPALAFILGVIPGFGIGHLVAGDGDGFLTWLVIDVLTTAVAIVIPAILDLGGLVDTLVVVGVVTLRLVEGFSAMEAAGGRIAWAEPSPAAPAWAMRPVRMRTVMRF